MATPLVTPRDQDILLALDRSPLTAIQLLTLSETFSYPFTNERKVRARMQVLAESGRVRRWPYAIAGRGAPNYYTLSRQGFAILYGKDAAPPGKRSFQAVGIARQQHTFALAEFIVHTAVACHRAGIAFTDFYRENSFSLAVGEERLYPDCAFTLATPTGRYHFCVELDNRSERIQSNKDTDSWDRKIRLYEAVQDASKQRFRVLVVPTRGSQRLTHILDRAATLARYRNRSLFYGINLPGYLAELSPVTACCFRDHRGQPASLVPSLRLPESVLPEMTLPALVAA